jgi:hypothetical protein
MFLPTKPEEKCVYFITSLIFVRLRMAAHENARATHQICGAARIPGRFFFSTVEKSRAMATEHSLNYVQLKVANEARLAEETRQEALRKNILVLTLEHLQVRSCAAPSFVFPTAMDCGGVRGQMQGFKRTADMLAEETGGSLTGFEVCDNVDLLTIVQEFEAYYTLRFGKAPKITRRHRSEGGCVDLGTVCMPRHGL